MTDSIGVILHPGEEHVAAIVAEHAAARGWATWSAERDVAESLGEHAADTKLLITVGGDGTFLLGARLAAPRGIPVLGVNRGRLGFLADVEVGAVPQAIDAFLAGSCQLERRVLLGATVHRPSGPVDVIGLNDVVVKSKGVTIARLRIDVDGALLGEFDADGVVVATATGSTAYALSAGGPPIDPRVEALVVVPLAPHAVMTRAVVLPSNVIVDIAVERGVVLAASDGQQPEVELSEGDSLRISPGPELHIVKLPGSPTFQDRLHNKLRFGMPLKGRYH